MNGVCDTYCEGCDYLAKSSDVYCDYNSIAGHKRPCRPGKECTVRRRPEKYRHDPRLKYLEAATLEAMKAEQGMVDVDDFDFICHVAFDAKPLTRRERADNVKKRDFLSRYSGVAREVLEALLDKYMNTGIYEIEKTEILKLDPFLKMGKPAKIAAYFGGKEGYLKAIKELEDAIYA